jgi:large subunit ribosomal protein L7/L12
MINKPELIESLKSLSLEDILEIVKNFETSFGIENFKFLPSTGSSVTKEKTEQIIEKTEFNLILEEVPADKKIAILKVIRTLTNLGLKEVKELVESAPKIVKENLSKEVAELAKKQIEEAGGKASLK